MFRDVGMMSKQQESPFPDLEKKAFGAGAMKRHAAASTFLLPLLLLELVSPGWGNRLPYFINYFFDTYLLINEDTPVGSSVTQLLARDLDNDPLVFGVVGEEASRFFAVESVTGVVWLRQPLDRETKSEFTVEFSVSDSQGVIKGTVNIQVGDVNDNAPRFHNQPYSVRIPEEYVLDQKGFGRLEMFIECCGNTPVGTPIFIVNATDPDQGAGGSVLYSFQPPSNFFAIDSGRGIVSVIRELDYEVTQAYQLQVNATDQDKNKPLSTLANLAITITDVQDMDPIFINLPYSTNIYENSPPGTTVRMITAIDQDKGRPRGIGYTIVSGQGDFTLTFKSIHPDCKYPVLQLPLSYGEDAKAFSLPKPHPAQSLTMVSSLEITFVLLECIIPGVSLSMSNRHYC
ncbi:hypothetical protein Q9966_001399 [Columba livia]|nr:hypothetical protein Q9966_001399 [Columba livia]